MKAIKIRKVGIGDGVQFTSLPENYYRATGKKLVDISRPWYFDFNPYIDRETDISTINEKDITELWNYPKLYEWPKIRESVYLSNAEIHAGVMGVRNPKLIRPRLYRYEEYPFAKRDTILLQTHGKSHGVMPDHIIEHVLKKYRGTNIYHIGLESDPNIGIPKISTPDLWELTRIIAQSKMLIGMDSGPSWIAAAYPDIVIKKVRAQFQYGYCEPRDWVPLDVQNHHSFWDDRMFSIHNTSGDDMGFTQSYKNI